MRGFPPCSFVPPVVKVLTFARAPDEVLKSGPRISNLLFLRLMAYSDRGDRNLPPRVKQIKVRKNLN